MTKKFTQKSATQKKIRETKLCSKKKKKKKKKKRRSNFLSLRYCRNDPAFFTWIQVGRIAIGRFWTEYALRDRVAGYGKFGLGEPKRLFESPSLQIGANDPNLVQPDEYLDRREKNNLKLVSDTLVFGRCGGSQWVLCDSVRFGSSRFE